MRPLLVAIAVVISFGVVSAQQPMGCETISVKKNNESFGTLQDCLVFSIRVDGRDIGRPADTESADELLRRSGFTKDRGEWRRQDASGVLSVTATIEGRGIRAFVTYLPSKQESISPPILEHLLRNATEVISGGPAPALIIRHETPAPGQYDNCSSTDEVTVSFSGQLLNQRYILLCTK